MEERQKPEQPEQPEQRLEQAVDLMFEGLLRGAHQREAVAMMTAPVPPRCDAWLDAGDDDSYESYCTRAAGHPDDNEVGGHSWA